MDYPTLRFDGPSILSDEPSGPFTAEGYYTLPNVEGYRDELVAGSVVMEPMPSFGHGAASLRVGYLLNRHIDEHKIGGLVLGETGYVLHRNPDTVRGPDASYVSAERLKAWNGKGPFFEGAPDLAVEVLSPSNTRAEMTEKVAEYLSAGGKEVWIADADRRQLTVHREGEAPRILGPEDTLDGGDVLPGFSVRVSALFV